MVKGYTSDYNSRYVAYAAAHGNGPDAQLDADRLRWPGGCMAGFITWTSARWREWRKARGMPEYSPLLEEHHADFDAWLDSWVLSSAAREV